MSDTEYNDQALTGATHNPPGQPAQVQAASGQTAQVQTAQVQTTKPRGRLRWLLIGLILGVLVGVGGARLVAWMPHDHAEEAEAGPRYHCPMHPNITSDKPGKCPICGMDLVPIDEPARGAAETSATTRESGAAPSVTSPTTRESGSAAKEVSGSSITGSSSVPSTLYHCPMHPNITSDKPGKCPICGMDLVKVEPAEHAGATTGASAGAASGAHTGHGAAPAGSGAVPGLTTVSIDPQRQQLIGLRLASAEKGTISGGFTTTGRVVVDETRVRRVNVKVQGYVERLFVDFTGKPVAKGQPLFSIYSPELVSAQQEYLLALRTRKALAQGGALSQAGEDMVTSARQRLSLWDIPASTIRELERTGEPARTITLVSPISGVVTAKSIVQGGVLNPGDTPFEITDLSSVWVLADLYQSDLGRVKVGMPAVFRTKAFPDRTFPGKVSFIEPLMDPQSRTVKLRIAVANPKGDLRPELYGDVSLRNQERVALRIPADAVIDSGERRVVFVALADGKFQPREVRTGASEGELIEVVSGLEPGEKVVTRANFLIDSESRLRAALAAMGGK